MKIKYPYKIVKVDCGHGYECHPPCTGRIEIKELDVQMLKKLYKEALIKLHKYEIMD